MFIVDLVRQPNSCCIDGAVQDYGKRAPHAAPGQPRRVAIVYSAAGVAMQLSKEAERLPRAAEGLTGVAMQLSKEAERLLRAAEGLTRAASAVLASTTSAFPKIASASRGKELVKPTPGQKDAEKQTGAIGR